MVTIEVLDITKLTGYIRIPSMAEDASITDTIRQRILYLGLSNQCRKCHKFGHHARICIVNKPKPQEGSTHQNHRTSSNSRKALDSRPSSHGASQAGKLGPARKDPTDAQTPRGGKARSEAKTSASRPSQSKEQIKGVLESLAPDPTKRNPTLPNQKDQVMTERSESPNHIKSFVQAEAEHKANGSQTPKAKLNFGLLGETSNQTLAPETKNNPFASPSNNIRGAESWNKTQTDNLEGWTFQ
ncbi:unnamed protein product [Sphagnum jensenii]|uniref:Uncharacterized protein n=1 Tax=Sphagnum jensenii TaxID=128206 RepID=A0ABP0WDJ5_9BRYO